MIKKFSKEYLTEELGLPYECEGGAIVYDKIVDTTRWSTVHELVFRLDDQPPDEAWRVHYSVGATEYQDEAPWEYKPEIEAMQVKKVTKMVEVWE